MQSIDLKTILANGNHHTVTLWIEKDKILTLLGVIPHASKIEVTQELVNKLQELVNLQNSNK